MTFHRGGIVINGAQRRRADLAALDRRLTLVPEVRLVSMGLVI